MALALEIGSALAVRQIDLTPERDVPSDYVWSRFQRTGKRATEVVVG